MIVYTVTMHAIYDHGCGGVFSTQQAAVDHARKLADDSDGHHDFRVEVWDLDEPVDLPGRWSLYVPRGASEEEVKAEKAHRRHSQGIPEITVKVGRDNDDE